MSRHHFGARLHQYETSGYRALALENEVIRVEILLDKGTDVISFLHKPSDTDFMWRSALGLVTANSLSRFPSMEFANIGDGYEGGWQECMPNGGPGFLYKEAPIPFHGEVLRLPWTAEIIEDSPEVVSVRLGVRTVRTPYRLEKTLALRRGSGVLEIAERLTNEASEAMRLMWGHHPAFGAPFLGPSCRIDLPPCRATTRRASPMDSSRFAFAADFDWPYAPLQAGGAVDMRVVPPPELGTSEWVCLSGFEEGWYAITNTERRVGFGMAWDPTLFRYLWFWQVWGGYPSHPWYGRHYNCALEPWTSWPDSGLGEALQNGSALSIGPSETIETHLVAVAYDGRTSVARIGRDGQVE